MEFITYFRKFLLFIIIILNDLVKSEIANYKDLQEAVMAVLAIVIIDQGQ